MSSRLVSDGYVEHTKGTSSDDGICGIPHDQQVAGRSIHYIFQLLLRKGKVVVQFRHQLPDLQEFFMAETCQFCDFHRSCTIYTAKLMDDSCFLLVDAKKFSEKA